MMTRLGGLWAVGLCLLMHLSPGCKEAGLVDASRLNVLLICVDDLRPELGCYGNTFIKTPRIDLLASSGFIFNNHYVQAAICGPSRSSMLMGKVSQEWDPWADYRKQDQEPTEVLALPHLFKRNGYRTVGIGKITHQPGGVVDEAQQIAQIPFSWDTSYTAVGKWQTPWRSFFAYANGDAHNTAMRIGMTTPRIPFEAADVMDDGYPDGLNAREAVKQLRKLKLEGSPFFMALGFYKPHLPFNAPKKYWDLYERDQIPLATNNFVPANLDNPYSINESPEVTTHYPWPEGPGKVGRENARILKHGYYASVSYIDAQIGKVLDELDRLELSDNTIVVLWSDHGWHLGEHTMFGKMSNFEIATRSPLIFRIPGVASNRQVMNHLVESIDLYPTLAELCDLNYPEDLEGESLVSLMERPDQAGPAFARSFYYRKGALGKTIRTERFRLVRWANGKDSTLAVELYDHWKDPQEDRNIAEEFPAITDSLMRMLGNVRFMDENMPFQSGWE